MILHSGDHGTAVVLLKYRFDVIRINLLANGQVAWGPSTSTDVYDLVMYLNMCAFQSKFGLTVDGIYGPVTEAKMVQVEAILGIHY